jgi:hypothetical protein
VLKTKGIAMYVDDVGFWVRILVPEDGTDWLGVLGGSVMCDL